MIFKTILRAWFHFVYPPRCLLCNVSLEDHVGLCAVCGGWAGVSLSTPLIPYRIEDLDAFVLNPFNESVRDLIHMLKYQGKTAIGRLWGEALGQKMRGMPTDFSDWIVVPVPLFHARKRERGYNQCDIIATALGRALGGCVETKVLKRVANTPTQTKLDRQERLQNVAHAFALAKGAKLNGKKVILVDDVITTGATIGACARALALGGVACVLAIAVTHPEMDTHTGV